MSAILEIEIKLPVADVEHSARQLLRLGAEPVEERTFEDNWVFDFPDRRLRASGRMIRLRTSGTRSRLTLKEKIAGTAGGEYKVRRERETEITDGDTIHHLATLLGLQVSYRYQKFRRTYRYDGLLITLDELPIGVWIELEGRPEAIDAFAARLGFGRSDYLTVTYRVLHEQFMRREGMAGEPIEMLFAGPNAA